jgi:galactoside 2-L-fucosyltransferase 1/2
MKSLTVLFTCGSLLFSSSGSNGWIPDSIQHDSHNSTHPASIALNCGYMIIDYVRGGMGNMMFNYAALLGVAWRNKKHPIMIASDKFPLTDSFEQRSLVTGSRWTSLTTWPEKIGESGCCRYNRQVENLECGKNYQLQGYLQSFKYFDRYREIIRREFEFLAPIKQEARSQMDEMLKKLGKRRDKCVLIGGHVRRGDFARLEGMKFGHFPARREYIEAAIRFYRSWFNSSDCLVFIFAGNDLGWNYENIPPAEDTFIIQSPSAAVDMCVLTMCNHTIMTSGTFGWWAGYLTGGTVTYQKWLSRPHSQHNSEYMVEDFIPPNWIPL